MAAKKASWQNNAKSRLFYIALVILPTVQFLLFWVYVNLNSILLAFKVYESGATSMDQFKSGFANFKHWFTSNSIIKGTRYGIHDVAPAIWVSLKTYLLGFITSVPLGLFFSYYMFKRMPGAGLFRILLFLPSILSAAPLALIFLNLTNGFLGGKDGWLPFLGFGLKDKENYFTTMTVFGTFISFGTSVLMYTNKMDAIAPEVIESAHLDGANGVKEFWYIVLPQSFSIVKVFLITSFAGAFANPGNAYVLFGVKQQTNITSVGYLLWNGVRHSGVSMWLMAPYAAFGLIITAIVVPLTFLFRWALNKYAWQDD